jgi:hypothetical protein
MVVSQEVEMPIEFRILGPLQISADGRLLPLGSPKQGALLGLLLVHAGETISRDRLIEELWGEARGDRRLRPARLPVAAATAARIGRGRQCLGAGAERLSAAGRA